MKINANQVVALGEIIKSQMNNPGDDVAVDIDYPDDFNTHVIKVRGAYTYLIEESGKVLRQDWNEITWT